MGYQGEEIIFALSSGIERAAIAIMRVSGFGSAEILIHLCGSLPKPRHAVLRKLWRDARVQEEETLLDEALVLWFPAPRSYTGEDGFELHLHAGPAVIEAVSEVLVTLGARPAEAGEFTRRAVQNGRMDLIEAEGIADLIAAETESQRKQALAQSKGALSRVYDQWAEKLKTLLAWQEAFIDFPDEELPSHIVEKIHITSKTLIAEMQQHMQEGCKGERIRRGLIFVITGPPNVGKSSLLNWLVQREAAIVSSQAGTTRDALEVVSTLAGVRVTFIDTAGLRKTEDSIEAEGVRRALFHVEQADCVIQMCSVDILPEKVFSNAILVGNKTDIGALPSHYAGHDLIPISLLTGEGLSCLYTLLEERALALTKSATGMPLLTRARHEAGVREACLCLERSLDQTLPELCAEELRLAMQALGRLTGHVGVEDLLEVIFSQFCIGK
ncbi:MAG: tRNA uridine-5-carboxymethylaminomethyl(34) synthesis GTPase MnmE [Acetobacter sp.]|nr:tRNA uridine-5-carboxymethylaminomethyl(34) synthesis GTPase MnmE [Acetobacter sp.]